MLGANEQRSEVQRILAEMSSEYEAAQRGLTGLAYGSLRHDFITTKMENISNLHTQLQNIVGDIATAMIAEQLHASADLTPSVQADRQRARSGHTSSERSKMP